MEELRENCRPLCLVRTQETRIRNSKTRVCALNIILGMIRTVNPGSSSKFPAEDSLTTRVAQAKESASETSYIITSCIAVQHTHEALENSLVYELMD